MRFTIRHPLSPILISLYDSFNALEAALWGVVAVIIPLWVRCETWQQRGAVFLGSIAFLAFGVTDLCEIGRAGKLPVWLWSLKIACGFAILAARFTWLGWNRFSWKSREFVFGLTCLAAVLTIIGLQSWLERLGTGESPESSPRQGFLLDPAETRSL